MDIAFLIRSSIFILFFLGMGMTVLDAGPRLYGSMVPWKRALYKCVGILCLMLSLVNVYIAFRWLMVVT